MWRPQRGLGGLRQVVGGGWAQGECIYLQGEAPWGSFVAAAEGIGYTLGRLVDAAVVGGGGVAATSSGHTPGGLPPPVTAEEAARPAQGGGSGGAAGGAPPLAGPQSPSPWGG